MTNCPNCGAPRKMYTHTCEYCGTYFNNDTLDDNFTFDYEIRDDDIILMVYEVYEDHETPIRIYQKNIYRSEISKVKPDSIWKCYPDGHFDVFDPPVIYNVRFFDIKGDLILHRDKIVYNLEQFICYR